MGQLKGTCLSFSNIVADGINNPKLGIPGKSKVNNIFDELIEMG